MHWMQSQKLVLASQSPRRKELLSQAGFRFEILIADIDEDDFPDDLAIKALPAYLAHAKASKICETLTDSSTLVLAADSLVFLNDVIYSKPRDRDDALRILDELSDQTHTVITGVCLKNRLHVDIVSVHTEVCFDRLSKAEIEFYIDTYLPYDKAGAYGIQDWIGLCKVKSIKGSYSNIMGLPMETVYTLLKHRMEG